MAGVTATETLLWRSAAALPRVRRLVEWSLFAVVISAAGQLFVLAGDIAGAAPWSALDRFGDATETDVGMALVVRIGMAVAAWVLVAQARPSTTQAYFEVILLLAIGLLATWSFAGHSRSLRWPLVGVPLDVIHHGAAAAWLGGLVIVRRCAIPASSKQQTVDIMQRFSRLAAWSVGAVVATGVVQAIRVTGGVMALVDTDHGKLLLLKVALLGGMVGLAQRNRVAVRTRFRTDVVNRSDVAAMRRALHNEFVVGLGIIAVTAALVVSPPGSSI